MQRSSDFYGNNCTIAFVYNEPSTFIVQDLKILSRVFLVIPVQWAGVVSIVAILRAVLQSDIVFVWWMSGQASTAAFVIAKALRKMAVFVAGGSDVAVHPDIHGRDARSAIRFLITRIVIRFVDCVICVSEFTLREVLSISAPQRYRVVYNAVDTDRFAYNRIFQKELGIITVAGGSCPAEILWRKGLDKFAKLSRTLPSFKVHLIGSVGSAIGVRNLFSPEVCVGRVSDDELLSFYQRAAFYCQLSRHEGFGVAVVEAMACECVPVVSDCGALPEVVGDCGIVIPHGDPIVAAKLIRESLAVAPFLGRLARKRVLSEFTVEKRSRELRNIILTLTKSRKLDDRRRRNQSVVQW